MALRVTVPASAAASIGYQFYDPDTGRFISEGQWLPVSPGAGDVEVSVEFPPVPGAYHVYVSAVDPDRGWAYNRGEPFTLIHATVDDQGRVTSHQSEVTTLRAVRMRKFSHALRESLVLPLVSIRRNRSLIRGMVQRDIMGRYRGSFADMFWAFLNPLLLMVTYWFVFGVVLRTRFGADSSRSGFVLYFLAAMLPWLAFSEAVGRSPHVILEHRNFVKKLVFPVEILPVNLVIAGLVTEAIAFVIYLVFLAFSRATVPLTVLWLPVLLIPQVLFTLGLAWCFAAVSVYVRDIAQVMGFALTLWFFLTPICYPETALPQWTLPILGKNPIFTLVRGYRSILLESSPPEWHSLWKLWLLAIFVFFTGHAVFHKLRSAFADVI